MNTIINIVNDSNNVCDLNNGCDGDLNNVCDSNNIDLFNCIVEKDSNLSKDDSMFIHNINMVINYHSRALQYQFYHIT
jgi:hypothetical protein